jgi:hypothetical protein
MWRKTGTGADRAIGKKGRCMQEEIDRQIEDGTFAWALNQNHALVIPPGR